MKRNIRQIQKKSATIYRVKKLLFIIFIFILLASGYILFKNSTLLDNPKMTPTKTERENTEKNAAVCSPSQLEGSMNSEVAAGNVYVQVTLKNITSSPCKIKGDNELTIGYPISVTNFQTEVKGTPGKKEFTLAPNQSIYSLIHYPNGPQCSSLAMDVNAMVSYNISDTESVLFTPSTGPTLDIPSCGNASEVTMIDLYPFSDTPVTP